MLRFSFEQKNDDICMWKTIILFWLNPSFHDCPPKACTFWKWITCPYPISYPWMRKQMWIHICSGHSSVLEYHVSSEVSVNVSVGWNFALTFNRKYEALQISYSLRAEKVENWFYKHTTNWNESFSVFPVNSVCEEPAADGKFSHYFWVTHTLFIFIRSPFMKPENY